MVKCGPKIWFPMLITIKIRIKKFSMSKNILILSSWEWPKNKSIKSHNRCLLHKKEVKIKLKKEHLNKKMRIKKRIRFK